MDPADTSAQQGLGTIRITRFCPLYREWLGRYGVYCDDQRIGEAPRGQPTEFRVSAGSHVIQVCGERRLGEPSNPLEIDLGPNMTLALECRTKSRLGGLTDKQAQAIERHEFHWVQLYEVNP